MTTRLLLLSTVLLAAACTSQPEANKAAAEVPAPAPPVPSSVQRRHVFSNAAAPDVLRLEIGGDSLLTAPAVLTISTAAGQEIYRQALAPGDLEAPLVYELKAGETATPARRESYVRQRLSTFFQDANFTSPAVAPGTAYQPGFVSAAEWQALQQPGTVGFSFKKGKEEGYRIAWLPSQKKVVRYAGFGG